MRIAQNIIGVLLAGTLLLAACGPAATQVPAPQPSETALAEATATPTPQEEKPPVTVTVAIGVDPESLDPAYETSLWGLSIMSSVYDRLVWRDATGELVPQLATSWEYVDPVTLELKLQQGVVFHNGEEFTADDVVFTFERCLDEDNPVPLTAILGGTIEAVEKVDTYTVRVRTSTPQALLLPTLARVCIVSKKAVEDAGEEYGLSPVGTGPFRFVKYDKGEQIVFEAFDGYWQGRAQLDRVIFRIIPDEFARFASLKTGEVDILTNLAPERIEEVEADENMKVGTAHSARIMYVAFDTRNPPFDDVRVRQAFSYAIDVDTIVDTILGGHGYPNPSVCDQIVFGYDPTLQGYAYDPERARALLAEAGYPDGLTVTLTGPAGRYVKDKEVQEAIAAQLAEVGVTVELNIVSEWAQLIDDIRAGKPQMHFLGCGNDMLDCDMTMVYRFISSASFGIYYNRPELDALIKEEQAEIDPQKREEIFAEIQRLIQEDAPWAAIYDQEDLYGMRARIDWQPRSDEMIVPYEISVSE